MTKNESGIVEGLLNLPYRWSMGPVFTRFFEELKKRRIMGTKCPECGRVLVPARGFCPRCFVDTKEWVQVSDKGTIKTWTVCDFAFSGQPKEPPYIQGLIDLDGADTALSHFIGDVDLSVIENVKDKVKIGMRVEAKWVDEPKGNIRDIEYFKPI